MLRSLWRLWYVADSDELGLESLLMYNVGEEPGQELLEHGESVSVHCSHELVVLSSGESAVRNQRSLVVETCLVWIGEDEHCHASFKQNTVRRVATMLTLMDGVEFATLCLWTDRKVHDRVLGVVAEVHSIGAASYLHASAHTLPFESELLGIGLHGVDVDA